MTHTLPILQTTGLGAGCADGSRAIGDELDDVVIPTSFTLDLSRDAPAALLAALQGFADHTSDPLRSDEALLAVEVVRTRMSHPVTIHQLLQPLLDPIGIHPANITITPRGSDGLELGFDTPEACRCAAQHLHHLGYILQTPDLSSPTGRGRASVVVRFE